MIARTLTALALLGMLAGNAMADPDGRLYGKIRADGAWNLCLGLHVTALQLPITTNCNLPANGYTTDLSYGDVNGIDAICTDHEIGHPDQRCLSSWGGAVITVDPSQHPMAQTELDEPILRFGGLCIDREGIGQPIRLMSCTDYGAHQMKWHIGWPVGVIREARTNSPNPDEILVLPQIQRFATPDFDMFTSLRYWRIAGHQFLPVAPGSDHLQTNIGFLSWMEGCFADNGEECWSTQWSYVKLLPSSDQFLVKGPADSWSSVVAAGTASFDVERHNPVANSVYIYDHIDITRFP